MKIAAIIPTLNEEQTLPSTLAHTTGLGFDDVIVVDGGSRDRTAEIVLSSWSATRTDAQRGPSLRPFTATTQPILLTVSPGRARQMNAGAALSQADVLLFLHADTRLSDTAREEIERALDDPACVGGHFDVRFERDTGWAWLIARLISLRSRWTGIATGDQALFVRRAVFAQLGGYADIPIMEDVELTTRLKRAGRVAALRTYVVTSYRRWERCGALRIIFLMWALRFLYWMGVSPHKLSHLYASVR